VFSSEPAYKGDGWRSAESQHALALLLDDEVRKRLSNTPNLKGAVLHLRRDIPKHVPLATARALIDPDRLNVGVSIKGAVGGGATTWAQRAIGCLSPFYAKRVGLALGGPAVLRLRGESPGLRGTRVSPKFVESLRGAYLALSPVARAALGSAVPPV